MMLEKEVNIVAVHKFNRCDTKQLMVNVTVELPMWIWERLHKYCNVNIDGVKIPEPIGTRSELIWEVKNMREKNK